MPKTMLSTRARTALLGFAALVARSKAELHPDIVTVLDVSGEGYPGTGWHDSYSVGDKCYCENSLSLQFSDGFSQFQVETPLGWMTVKEACEFIGPGPGSAGRPKYNDIQCGNGPPADDGGEHTCPGRTDIGPEGCGQIGPKWDFTTPSPTSSPTASPTPPPTVEVRAPPPPPIESFFVDCGEGEEELLSGSYWMESNYNIVENAGSYRERNFETSRSGFGFVYTIPGFASGVTASITLGWTETWSAACGGGQRQFNVDVNGVPFVTDFDVSDTAGGCNIAVFETKSFQATREGTFVIEFSKGSAQNPFINIIDIEV